MTQYEKLLKKFLENPESIKLKELIKILEKNGFKRISKNAGSHQKYSNGKSYFTLSIHKNDVKIGYKTMYRNDLLRKNLLNKAS